MHREGHVGIGLLLYAPFAYALAFYGLLTPLALGLVAVVFWSFAPDFDMRLPLVSHRGITHTYLFSAVAGVATGAVALYLAANGTGGGSPIAIRPALYAQAAAAAFGFGVGCLGVLSHLLGDVLTPMGIAPGYPFSTRRYSLDLVYAANGWANRLLSGAGAVTLVGALLAGRAVKEGNVDVIEAVGRLVGL